MGNLVPLMGSFHSATRIEPGLDGHCRTESHQPRLPDDLAVNTRKMLATRWLELRNAGVHSQVTRLPENEPVADSASTATENRHRLRGLMTERAQSFVCRVDERKDECRRLPESQRRLGKDASTDEK